MGTITSRKRGDGTVGHTARIRIKASGKVIHAETQTFDRKPAAQAWLKKRETELAQPGALDKARVDDPTLADVIDEYNRDKLRPHGKTKDQVLNAIKKSDLGLMRCSQIDSPALVSFAKALGAKVQPQTTSNYLSHLASVFTVARPAWGYPLDKQAMDDAMVVCRRLGIIARSRHRDRRPTLDELDRILAHYAVSQKKRVDSTPMTDVILYAIFSTRRQEEITRQAWADLDDTRSEIWVRDMKNPGEKIGNDVRVTLPPEAKALIQRQPRTDAFIWPYNAESISTSFTRTCKLLGIDDLHFHDLRHDGISRLFELGWTIPQVATVSGHRSWSSLKRYTHIERSGDKYADWRWRPAATI